MRAVPLSQGDVDGQIYCSMCIEPCEEFYSLTTEDGEEWDKLELTMGDLTVWFVCEGCLKIIEELLGYEIIISTVEEVMELEDSMFPSLLGEEGYKILRDNLDAINERKCPSCGHPIAESFDYMKVDQKLGMKQAFRSIKLSCHHCDFSQTLGPPITDAALGYFLFGTILGYDSHLIRIEVAPSYKKNITDRGEKLEQIILKHKVDLPVLGAYTSLMDLVDILVIGDIVVRVGG